MGVGGVALSGEAGASMQRMTEVDGNQDVDQKAESAAGQQNPDRHCHHRVKHQRASSSKRAFSTLRCGTQTLRASPRPTNHPCWYRSHDSRVVYDGVCNCRYRWSSFYYKKKKLR